MRYESTRGGPAVSGWEAVWRGLSETGGLYVPASLPEALEMDPLAEQSLERVLAVFFERFLPDFSLEIWERVILEALDGLKGEEDRYQLPLTPLNPYLDRYYLLNADSLPTGSLADLSAAIFSALLPYLQEKRQGGLRPLVLAAVTEDQALAALSRPPDLEALFFVPQNGVRGEELAALPRSQEALYIFGDRFDDRYREFSLLASDPSFEEKLNQMGFDPLYFGPGHLLEVLTAGALATAVISRMMGEIGGKSVDFTVPKDHLAFLAGLVYASSLQVPVGFVYVGENEPATLAPLFASGRLPGPRRNRRRDDPGVAWPVNLERLLFEVTGRDSGRMARILDGVLAGDRELLSKEEIKLLNQSVRVEGNDYRRCQRVIRSVYDQTDYLVGRETADAIACWAKHSKKRDDSPVCYVQERTPLADHYTSGRALFGDGLPRDDRTAALTKLSEESGIPLRQLPGSGSLPALPRLEGSLEETVLTWLGQEEAHSEEESGEETND